MKEEKVCCWSVCLDHLILVVVYRSHLVTPSLPITSYLQSSLQIRCPLAHMHHQPR